MNTIDELFDLLVAKGTPWYGGERVTQLQHAMQCADEAERAGASPALITAALFHDIGHLIDRKSETAPCQGIDRHHEEMGAGFLSRWFGPDVTEPVRLHVPAKRFLCAVEETYFDGLSTASVRSLELQGGPLDGSEADAFIKSEYGPDAVLLRRWDDAAKDPERKTPDLAHFQRIAEQCAREHPPTQ